MFTGIIQSIGKITSLQSGAVDVRLTVHVGNMPFDDVKMGESISINGACMTVVAFEQCRFSVDVSRESLALTTLGQLTSGSPVNLERALTLADRLGGHLVSGHVDGVGKITQRVEEGKSTRFIVQVPEELTKYIAHKGSICIDGASLTVNELNKSEFSLQIIPHTLQETIFSEYQVGSEVNLEVDIIARYLERLLLSKVKPQDISREFLSKAGFY